AFGQRNLFGFERSVSRVFGRVARVVGRERRGRGVITASPDVWLLDTVSRRRLGLVESLQRAVVSLVLPPRFIDRNPEQIHPLERQVKSLDRALERRSIGHVKGVTGLLHLVPG